jgi:hypothetical protein
MVKNDIVYDIIFFNIKKAILNKVEKEVSKRWEE